MNALSLITQQPHFLAAIMAMVSGLIAIAAKNPALKKITHNALYSGLASISIWGGYLNGWS